MSRKYVKTEVRRAQIAAAALDLIAARGLRSFTTRAIAERVGITDGTIFRHFDSKQAIVMAAIEHLEERMFGGDKALDDPPDLDPLAELERFFVARATLVGGASSVGRLMFSEELGQAAGPAGRARVFSWRERNLAIVQGCFERLAKHGRLRPDITPRQAVPLVQGMLLTFMMAARRADPEADQPLEDPADLRARIDAARETLRTLLIV